VVDDRRGVGGRAGGRVRQLPHALTVVRAHGQSGKLTLAYPLTIDGMIYASSMVLLNAARRGLDRPWLAYFALGLGVAATLAANVVAGLAYGPVGALVAAWPAPALVISYELLMLVIRSSVKAMPVSIWGQPGLYPATPGSQPDALHPDAFGNGHGAPEGGKEAAELSRGELPSIRQVQREMHLGQPRAQQVHSYLELLARA
jgi:hypothetical protein